ncbi:hypothetical protein OF83DRAFT_1124073 [Amylostereum chailletii]|nr:hypothetical protein OF83DRAFT_1124073 [Amylostereum chailletii]
MPLGTTIPIHCRVRRRAFPSTCFPFFLFCRRGSLSLTTSSLQAWMIFVSLFIDAAYALSTFMVVIRIAAIWDKNRPVMFVAVVAWSSVLGIYLRNIISPSASNSDLAKSLPKSFATCITLDSAQARETSIVTLSSYLVLLFIMMVGLQRTRGASPLAMWNMLYRQGLVWLALALISEVTVIIIISSNIGPIVDMLIQMPRVLITSLGATHMYRALYNFSAMNDIQCQMIRDWDHLTQPDPMLRRRSMDVSTGTKFPFLPLEVEIHVASEQR